MQVNMNRIRGIETKDTEGIVIFHDEAHQGVLVIQDRNDRTDFSISATKDHTIITSSELEVDTPTIRVSGWRHSFLYQDLVVNPDGKLVPRPPREWMYAIIGVMLFTLAYWK